MQLGAILSSDPGEPMVSRPVAFYLLKQSPEGLRRVRVKAQLLPVSEADRQRAKVETLRFLHNDPNSPYRTDEKEEGGYEITTPTRDEEICRFLAQALYDSEDPSKRLVREIDYPAFRKGLMVAQIDWLIQEYANFVIDEYPEIITQKQKDKLVAQAEGK